MKKYKIVGGVNYFNRIVQIILSMNNFTKHLNMLLMI